MTGLAQIFDPTAAAIVVGGCILATITRCGLAASHDAATHVLLLPFKRFRYHRNRAVIAPLLGDISKNGMINAKEIEVPDRALNMGLQSMLRRRSFAAFALHQQNHREERLIRRYRAAGFLDTAGDLAPILGMAGTLFALSRLDVGKLSSPPEMIAAISVAVLSTLYGLLLAHFVCHPLARAIERKGKREEENRSAIADWVEKAVPKNARTADPARRNRTVVANHAASNRKVA